MVKTNKVAVLGSGSWGTALAHHLARAGHAVTLWGIETDVLEGIRINQRNPRYISSAALDPRINTSDQLKKAVDGAELLIIVVPSAAVREVGKKVKGLIAPDALVVSTSKGLEDGSFKSMSDVLREELGEDVRTAVLSGPSFALEVAKGLPTAVTIAASTMEVAEEAASAFHFDNLRVYTSTDVIGVGLGGVMKNVIAIGVGVVDGVGMGHNARAALITRGLSEMQRLVVALGGEATTVAGLSGLGDLLLTATSDLSRNRRVGIGLGKGLQLDEILADLGEVAEGVKATKIVLELARMKNVSVPITEEVDKLLSGQRSVKESVSALLTRSRRSEAIQ